MPNNYTQAVDTFADLIEYVKHQYSEEDIENMKYYLFILKTNIQYELPKPEVA